jgi:hypothetical protein
LPLEQPYCCYPAGEPSHLEGFSEKLADILLDQLQVVQHILLWREAILPGDEQWNVAEARMSQSWGSQDFAAHGEGSFDRSLTVSGPVDLDVKTDSGGITVTRGSIGWLRVHAILKAEHGWFESPDVESSIRELERNPPVEQTGNRIRMGYVRERNLLKGISMHLEIQAPPDTQVRARADSGGVCVQGIRGPADCHTDSGGNCNS